MTDLMRYNAPSVFTERMPQINYDDGTVDFLNNLSGAFLDVAQKAHRAQLESEVAEAKKAGALHGTQQGMHFKPSKRGGIVHKAYNDAGIQTASVQMSLKSQEAIRRIAFNNPGNPGAQKQSMEAWADSFAGDLPDDMLVPFRNTFDQLASAQLTKANSDLSKIRQSEAVAKFNDYEANVTNGVEMFAPNMFQSGAVGTDAAKAVETMRKNYVELLAQNGPGAEYSVGGYQIPAAAGRSGAFSVEEIGAKIKEFDKMVLGSAVKGDFLRELEAGRGVSAYFNFVKGNTALTTVGSDGEITQVGVDGVLEIEDKEKIASFMRTHISTLNSLEDAENKKSDRARKDYNDAVMDQALKTAFSVEQGADGRDVLVGNPDALRMQYLNAVNDDSGLVKMDTINDLRSLMETVGSGDIPDPVIVSSTKLSVLNREITSIPALPNNGLGDQARGEMVQLLRQINSGQHWSNSQRYSTSLQLGKAALAPEAATGFALFSDPNKQSSADYAEFQERLMNDVIAAEQAGTLPVDINAMPGKDEFDIQGRAREIIQDIKERRAAVEKDPEIEAINEKIKMQRDILDNPDTKQAEAKKARDELKKLDDQKARIQMNNQFTGFR